MATQEVHAMAPHHLPGFLPGADGSDPLFTGITIFLIALVLGVGAFYFTLHSLPEKMAHEVNSNQLQVIGILCLLALFTHNHAFWVIAILLAAFRMPDFLSPIRSIADSLKAIKDKEL